jgi:hypothetical protein
MTANAQLAQLADRLRGVFAEERAAIAALDHARLDALLATKQQLAAELAMANREATPSAELRALFEQLRVEAHASAMLAAIAGEAVRGILGYEPANTYDRRARAVGHRSSQIIARY